MSFQAYLDAVEDHTGKTPQELLDVATERGFGPHSRATEVANWLKQEYGIGHGHAMAVVHVVRRGPTISDKHVGGDGPHRDESTVLRLDGLARRSLPS